MQHFTFDDLAIHTSLPMSGTKTNAHFCLYNKNLATIVYFIIQPSTVLWSSTIQCTAIKPQLDTQRVVTRNWAVTLSVV